MVKWLESAIHVYKGANAHLGDLEDFADRFNYIGCVAVLSICILVVSAKQYFLKPIACFIATSVGGTNLLEYVENYCWVQGTVPITYTGRMPVNDTEWNQMEEKKIRKFPPLLLTSSVHLDFSYTMSREIKYAKPPVIP